MPVGQRAPTLNMSKLLRQLGFRTGQSRKLPIIEMLSLVEMLMALKIPQLTINELQIPNVQAYVRTIMTKNFTLERAGSNIVGASMMYLPRLSTLKEFPNLNQSNNVYFNDVEGFDTIIDVDHNVFEVPTSGTGNWTGVGVQ